MTEPNRTDTHPATEIDMTVDSSGTVEEPLADAPFIDPGDQEALDKEAQDKAVDKELRAGAEDKARADRYAAEDKKDLEDQLAKDKGSHEAQKPLLTDADASAEPTGSWDSGNSGFDLLARAAPAGFPAFRSGGSAARDEEARDAELARYNAALASAQHVGIPTQPAERQAQSPHGSTPPVQPAEPRAEPEAPMPPATKAPLLSEQELEEMIAKTPAQREVRLPDAVDPAPHSPSEQLFDKLREQKSDATSNSKPADREEQMAQRNAEINARVKAGAPVKPWNPVAVAKRAKSLSRAAKQKAAAAALAAIIAGLGLCATSASAPARPGAAGATAAPTEFIPTAEPVRVVGPAVTAAPVGATLTVVPVYSFLVTERCPDVQGSQLEVTSDGTPRHVVRLGPRVVTNPAPGTSVTYDWGMFTYPGPSCPWSLGLEYERPRFTGGAFLLFFPYTTYRYVQTQPTRAPGGGQQIATILTVTNQPP